MWDQTMDGRFVLVGSGAIEGVLAKHLSLAGLDAVLDNPRRSGDREER